MNIRYARPFALASLLLSCGFAGVAWGDEAYEPIARSGSLSPCSLGAACARFQGYVVVGRGRLQGSGSFFEERKSAGVVVTPDAALGDNRLYLPAGVRD